jgi:hypothetical protein
MKKIEDITFGDGSDGVTPEELKKEWEIEFDEKFNAFPDNPVDYVVKKEVIDEIKSFISSLLAKQQEEFVKMIDSKQEDDYKVLLQTPSIDESCRCNFENGDIIELDKEGRHKKCGKYLPLPVPIKTSFEKFKEDLLADIKSKLESEIKKII